MDNHQLQDNRKAPGVIGIIAHVDAGKTTLAEAMLFNAGVVRKIGRVDDGNTVMDTHELERKRGITIFSAEAPLQVKDRSFSLLDTPGHVDFSAEMERTLSVLDACILVISGTDGVQAHTRTLWRLLSFYNIPTFIFVTKMDYARFSEEEIMNNLTEELGDSLVKFGGDPSERDELAATCDEDALQEFLENGSLSKATLKELIDTRQIYPVYFGSGLKNSGIDEFLEGLYEYVPERQYPDIFGARAYKISHDADGNRLVHLKITGGVLKARDLIGQEKVNQIRIYTGEKYAPVNQAEAGELCTVTGLSAVQNGDGLGYEQTDRTPVLEPVMQYTIMLPDGVDAMAVLPDIQKLQEEDPQLHITWNSYTKEIQVGLMGEVQAEILKSLIAERYHLDVEIGKGRVLYRETISRSVEGVGHFEPLRHYAEVHLLLEPLPRGSGVELGTAVSESFLAKNWQNLILQHLKEKEHLGVLTGSPLTDVRITLVSGRAHLKHTEGGDFRQATYRAVRQGLMCTGNILLEPYYRFRLEVPTNAMSRAINDIRAKFGTFLPPIYAGDYSVLSGRGPVTELCDYAKEVSSYTGGTGHLLLESDGYDVCHNPEEVLKSIRYFAEADADNSPDSVFCSHGAGFLVPWNKVPEYMHIPFRNAKKETLTAVNRPVKRDLKVDEEELEAIMLREFGPIRRPQYGKPSISRNPVVKKDTYADDMSRIRPNCLIVDGYNVIFAWDELKKLAAEDISAAREKLAHIISNYSAFIRCETILVFDGYRVPGNRGETYDYHNIRVVYTKERESADLYIENLLKQMRDREKVCVVTSDGIIQLSALRNGILRMSAQGFEKEVESAGEKITELLEKNYRKNKTTIGDVMNLDAVKSNLPETDKKVD